jgi:hypothetical protein
LLALASHKRQCNLVFVITLRSCERLDIFKALSIEKPSVGTDNLIV